MRKLFLLIKEQLSVFWMHLFCFSYTLLDQQGMCEFTVSKEKAAANRPHFGVSQSNIGRRGGGALGYSCVLPKGFCTAGVEH